ncbi:hypothetical protein D9O36_01965 [Zobellia amurskyensis]|uniref:Uncharacterized protein n=1 Tax=Zobellia amurskyensis TaxID=248905 RepID=A0A7X3CZS3_9FLAO|nr:hypothetical protein [Zobellia amurskyensis]
MEYFKYLNYKKNKIMANTNDKRKFKRKREQVNPTNPTGNVNQETNEFNIEEDTIRNQQNKG